MTHTPLVSIVLPTYNGAKYLAQSLQSCLDQTYSNWELIIVDDCSTDDTPEIIARYVQNESRIRSISHATNKKLPGALNTGFTQAKGEYCTWTSDDNYYLPEALTKMVNYLQNHPKIGVVYTDYNLIDEGGKIIKVHKVKPPERLVVGCIIGASFLYRRQVHLTVGEYCEDSFLAEDYDFWLRTSIHYQLAPLHQTLYCYRYHNDSLGAKAQPSKGVLYSSLEVKERNLQQMDWVNKTLRAEAYMHMAKDAQNLRYFVKMLKYITKAIFCSPKVAIKHLARNFSNKYKFHSLFS